MNFLFPELTDGQIQNLIAWIDMLRSGSVKQGLKRLRTDEDYFCCLGVGGCVVDPSGSNWKWYAVAGWLFNSSRGGLYGDTLNALGLTSDGADELSAFNDAGVVFAEIANMLESELVRKMGKA